MYVQVITLEKRRPVMAPNVESVRFRENSLIVVLAKEEQIVKLE